MQQYAAICTCLLLPQVCNPIGLLVVVVAVVVFSHTITSQAIHYMVD